MNEQVLNQCALSSDALHDCALSSSAPHDCAPHAEVASGRAATVDAASIPGAKGGSL